MSTETKLDLLAFGAHPDDIELSCCGTILSCTYQGYKVGIIDLTRGEKGTRGTAQIREQEKLKASRILRLTLRETLNIPDTEVRYTKENIRKIIESVRKYKPHVVILPPDDKRHPDHSNANRIVYEACFLAGLKNLDTDGKPHRPYKVLNVHKLSVFDYGKPTFILDITKFFRKKLQVINCYKSQFPPNDKTRVGKFRVNEINEWIEATSRYYGALIGTKYGEGFITKEVVQVDDIIKLKVPSM
ncbi:MAG: bacillithiol biosynthesis deacetylase BshB1 [Planctomycetes bacterium]|nr:bacillithiol biosynthesis deacetylase BshB1 [Planctomycetota bacterium]